MSAKNTTNSFGYIAKSFHWIIALLIVSMLILGYFLEDFPSSLQSIAYNTHKSIGIILLALIALRLGWRWYNIQPGYSSSYPAWIRYVAHVFHYAIYLAMILMPLSGWLMSTASGKIPHFLGWFYFPMPGISPNEHLASVAFQTHNILAIVLITLVTLHLSAVLFHHFVLGDNVLKRMLFGQNQALNQGVCCDCKKYR